MHGTGKVWRWCAVVGVACRGETDGGSVSPMTSKVPAMVRRRNPTAVVRAAIFVVSWILLVFVEVFMALIINRANAS